MDDWEVTVSYVDYPPGRVGAAHHHAGFVLAYVLEGAVIAKISGQGEEKTYTDRADVLRAARRDARSLEEREPDAARKAAGDDLREEGLDADDAGTGRSRARRSVGAAVKPSIIPQRLRSWARTIKQDVVALSTWRPLIRACLCWRRSSRLALPRTLSAPSISFRISYRSSATWTTW